MATLSTDFPDLLPAGASAPDFSLPDVCTGRERTLAELAGPAGTMVVFLCAHCPYVVHVRGMLSELSLEFFPQGISTIGISANDPVSYPDDSPENLRRMAEENELPFPVLFDATQETARAYTAVCTPDFFLFDKDRKLAYRGRLDSSSPRNGQPLTVKTCARHWRLWRQDDPYQNPGPAPSAAASSGNPEYKDQHHQRSEKTVASSLPRKFYLKNFTASLITLTRTETSCSVL